MSVLGGWMGTSWVLVLMLVFGGGGPLGDAWDLREHVVCEMRFIVHASLLAHLLPFFVVLRVLCRHSLRRRLAGDLRGGGGGCCQHWLNLMDTTFHNKNRAWLRKTRGEVHGPSGPRKMIGAATGTLLSISVEECARSSVIRSSLSWSL